MTDRSYGNSERLDRSLKDRHIQFLALGGVIGVGLFYGAAQAVKLAGPGVIVAYVLTGMIVSIVMRALGEMTVEKPGSGSFSSYAGEFLGPRAGFITGGMWWFYWVATVMSELAAIGKLIQFWFPDFPAWIPGLIALILFTCSNLLVVRIFGELESGFAILKILAIVCFMVFGGLLILTGVFNHGQAVGLTNLWINKGGFLPNGWLGVIMAISLVIQAYSGIETLAVEAGESDNPNSSLPRAFKSVTFRILVLYIGSIVIMLCAYPWTNLSHSSESPYVLLFTQIGLPAAATIVNLIIIFSGLSSCNTGVYGGSRILYSMAKEKVIPIQTAKLNQNNVPYISVIVTAIAISIGTLITYISPNYVYIWITSASAFASIFTWIMILVLEILFRRGRSKKQLSYPMPFWPILPILGLILLIVSLGCIIYSPLTRVSVFSGVIWLVLLIVYSQVSIKPKKKDRRTSE